MKTSILLIAILFFIGCGDSNSDPTDNNSSIADNTNQDTVINTVEAIDPKYYGSWVYVHNGETLDVISSTELEFDELDENLIEVTDNGLIYHLIRSSISNINVTGEIEVNSNIINRASSYENIAGLNVILKNINDDNIKKEVVTDSNGVFIASDLPSGTYTLSVDDSNNNTISSEVVIKDQSVDLGTYKLTGDDIHNFKAELILDKEFIYADTSIYTGKIRINNISDVIGLGLNYNISLNDDKKITFNVDNVLGSIPAKSYTDINISFSFDTLYVNQKTLSIDVSIGDVNLNRWQDNFKFEIYKEPIEISINTKSANIRGYITLPDTNEIKQVDISSGKIILPTLSNNSYNLIFSNPSLTDETAYSIAVNKVSSSDFNDFKDTAAHEPNNKKADAKDLSINDSTFSYLHVGDLDYWTISTPEDDMLLKYENNTSRLFKFEIINDAHLSTVYTSNEALIDITSDKNNTISISDGSIILNGIDTESSSVNVTNNDKIKIKTISANNYYESKNVEIYYPSGKTVFTLNAPEIHETDFVMWEDSNLTISQRLNHNDANNYCQNLNYASFTNWRLPSVSELKTIFSGNYDDPYWSSTYSNLLGKYYTVHAYKAFGGLGFNDLTRNSSSEYFVRCIRTK